MENVFYLSGEKGFVGCKVLTIGIDYNGDDIVEICTITNWNEEKNTFSYKINGFTHSCAIIVRCHNGEVVDNRNRFWIYSDKRLRWLEEQCIGNMVNARSNVIEGMRSKVA